VADSRFIESCNRYGANDIKYPFPGAGNQENAEHHARRRPERGDIAGGEAKFETQNVENEPENGKNESPDRKGPALCRRIWEAFKGHENYGVNALSVPKSEKSHFCAWDEGFWVSRVAAQGEGLNQVKLPKQPFQAGA